MSTTTIGIKVDSALADRLRAVAEAVDRAPHWVAKRALEQFIDREEQRLALRAEDLERWERYVVTGESVSGDEADAWLRRVAGGEDVPWRG
jgi:predicted transcriptional regulator